MVKYACKHQERVFELILHRGARGRSKVYAGRLACLSLFSLIFCGFESRRMQTHIAKGLEICPSGQKKGCTHFVYENDFLCNSLSFGEAISASVHLAEQCKSEPCLKVDTVFSRAVPKDFFPHWKGGTQIFSRCFCMNDSGIKRNYDWSDYIMLFFFPTKRNKLLSKLIKAFPKEYTADVEAVCNSLTVTSKAYSGALYSDETTEWSLLPGEKIEIPYRVYLSDKLIFQNKLTAQQQVIYHCIFSRSYDGYVRQKHIEALLDSDTPEWAMPYIVKICDEYVKEILDTVYQKLQGRNCETYKALCQRNFDYFKLGHCRMISYWNEYYRYDYYRYKEYIGKKLYGECFGYNKTGQKSIQF